MYTITYKLCYIYRYRDVGEISYGEERDCSKTRAAKGKGRWRKVTWISSLLPLWPVGPLRWACPLSYQQPYSQLSNIPTPSMHFDEIFPAALRCNPQSLAYARVLGRVSGAPGRLRICLRRLSVSDLLWCGAISGPPAHPHHPHPRFNKNCPHNKSPTIE